jgi:hypothetical protein
VGSLHVPSSIMLVRREHSRKVHFENRARSMSACDAAFQYLAISRETRF